MSNLKFNGKTYDRVKWSVQVGLPASSALYFGLSTIWGLPAPDKVTGTIALVTTFLGICLGISKSNYENSGDAYDGTFLVREDPEGNTKFRLDLSKTPDDLGAKKEVRVKVEHTYLADSFLEEDPSLSNPG